MIAFLYLLLFVVLLSTYKKKAGLSVGVLLLSFYTLSALLTFLESFEGSPNSDYLDLKATIYYAVCMLISLWPFLVLGKLDCRYFSISEGILKYLSYVLIFFGLIDFISSSIDLFNNRAILMNDIGQLRMNFYDTMDEVAGDRSIFDKLTIMVKYLQYLSPFCCIYFITKRKNTLAWLLFIASISFPLHNMVIGEREASLKFLANYAFCVIFFRPHLSHETKKKLLRGGLIGISPFILFIVVMTIARASITGISTGDNIFAYGGDQPFFFTHIFNDASIASQALGGRMCFRYFFPINERMQNQINDYINSDIYLNQFGGLPGSFYLDFGYYAILVIALITLLYFMVIKGATKHDGKYPFYLLLLFYFSYQVCFMNIFYYDYIELYAFFLTLVLFLYCFAKEKIGVGLSRF